MYEVIHRSVSHSENTRGIKGRPRPGYTYLLAKRSSWLYTYIFDARLIHIRG